MAARADSGTAAASRRIAPLRQRISRPSTLLWLLAGSVAVLGALVVLEPRTALLTVVTAGALFNLTQSSLEVSWRSYGWHRPEQARAMAFPPAVDPADAGFDFVWIVPGRHEQAVIRGTLENLARQTHPRSRIIVSLCSDDPETIAEAERARRAHPDVIEIVHRLYPKNMKPFQLNTALELIPDNANTFVGICDAESTVAPDLCRHVEALVRESGANVVQGGVQLTNLERSWRYWYGVHNILEYYVWFASRMFFQVKEGFVPYGGNTIFIRSDIAHRTGGWEGKLTEDCHKGVIDTTQYDDVVVRAAYEPALATQEETPSTLLGLYRQRRRWGQGFWEVLVENKWRDLPTLRQRFLAWYLLTTPFLQAFGAVLIPVALYTAIFVKAPVALVLVTYAPLVPIAVTICLQCVALRDFGRDFGKQVLPRHYAMLLLGAYPYQLVLMAASVHAVLRHALGRNNWDKTAHAGRHRNDLPALAPVGAA